LLVKFAIANWQLAIVNPTIHRSSIAIHPDLPVYPDRANKDHSGLKFALHLQAGFW
jgi:hypothetical protein